jgi:hypothetical protein
VETHSPTAALSTLSRYHALYNRMQGLYRMTYHFDKLAHYEVRVMVRVRVRSPSPSPHPDHGKARVYSLRAYLMMLIRRMTPQPRSMEPAEVGLLGR